jgi:hypothetical protein
MNLSTFANRSVITLGLRITMVQVLEGNRRINFIFIKDLCIALQRGRTYIFFPERTSVQAFEVNGRKKYLYL